MSNSRNTHWCYSCRRPVQLRGRDVVCPNCNEGFIQELNDMVINPLEFIGLDNVEERDRRFRIMEAFPTFMRHRPVNRSHRHDIIVGSDSIPEHAPGYAPLLLFGGQIPVRLSGHGGFEALFNGTPGIGLMQGNTGDYFIGPGLEELFEQLSANDRRGPPPASRSSIDAMPTIKITHKLLRSDSHCPVCQDKFELGLEELPPQGLSSNRGSNGRTRSNSDSNSGSGRVRENQGRRNPFSFFWPFRSSNSSNNGAGGSSSPTQPIPENSHHTGYSGWPFE
ncbi:hypothetical protein K1719_027107 [Acacia pycnantha]|nr:hypothetical protein K1719_027107 [Acacia pycnantha]